MDKKIKTIGFKKIIIKYYKKYESFELSEVEKIVVLKKALKKDLLLLFRKINKIIYNRIHHERQLAYMINYSKSKWDDDKDGYKEKRRAQILSHYVKVIKGVKNYKESDKLIEMFS